MNSRSVFHDSEPVAAVSVCCAVVLTRVNEPGAPVSELSMVPLNASLPSRTGVVNPRYPLPERELALIIRLQSCNWEESYHVKPLAARMKEPPLVRPASPAFPLMEKVISWLSIRSL